MEGLRNTSSMEGWPPGIHGAVLIDFKVPVSKLNSEVKEMIAKMVDNDIRLNEK